MSTTLLPRDNRRLGKLLSAADGTMDDETIKSETLNDEILADDRAASSLS